MAATEPTCTPTLVWSFRLAKVAMALPRGTANPHAAAIIGFGDPQPGIGLRLRVGDRVEDDVAIRPEGLGGDDDPLRHQQDAEFFGKHRAELDLKTRRVPCLAGIGQGIGMGAEMERAAGSDHVKRPRRGGLECQREQAMAKPRLASGGSGKRTSHFLAPVIGSRASRWP